MYALGHFAWLKWHGLPHDIDEYGIYKSYRNVAKYIFWSVPMIYYAIGMGQDKMKMKLACFLPLTMAIFSLLVSILAFREHWLLGGDRVALSFDGGTMVAYMMTIVHILALHQILIWVQTRNERWFIPVLTLLGIIVVQYMSILLTETRAAIIVFPVLVTYMLLAASPLLCRRPIFIGVGGVLLLVLVLGYNSIIKPRFDSLKSDVVSYQVTPGEVTSVGARFSMWDAGWFAAKARPFGERIHERETLIHQAVDDGKLNEQVLGFLKIHLHDDMMETMSLRGLWGGALLLILYVALAWQARLSRGAVRLGLTLVLGAMVAFGIGDVLFMWTKLVVLLLLSITLICFAWPGPIGAGRNV